MNQIGRFELYGSSPEYHANFSITYGELLSEGLIDWDSDEWQWNAYDEEQRARIITEMSRKFYYYEINAFPFRRWKMNFLQALEETQRKFNIWYKNKDDLNPLYSSNKWYKDRTVNSDFPQAYLSNSNSDYVSSGTDSEREEIEISDAINKLKQIRTDFTDVDTAFLQEIENRCFTCLGTIKFNAIY